MQDIRDTLFSGIKDKTFCAALIPEQDGVLSGAAEAAEAARALGLGWKCAVDEGGALKGEEPFAWLTGGAKALAAAEEQVIGLLAKTSGIATAARQAVLAADGRVKVVCGAWKKMPPSMKQAVRLAITAGGASFRICEPPMVYIDKNYIRMLGSIPAALAAAGEDSGTKIIQIKGREQSVAQETCQAVQGGADVLMVDTGSVADLERCLAQLDALAARDRVHVAFAGGVRTEDIPLLADRGVNMLCVGRQIVDGPLLDIRMDVTGEVRA